MRRTAVAIVSVAIAGLIVTSSVRAEDPRFAAGVAGAVETVIVPGYRSFRAAADHQADAMSALCAAPDAERRTAAQQSFTDLVVAFSRMELIRFGPARENYNIERLFFWPDRRSRGLKQVQGVIQSADPTAVSVDTLQQKSVAVQGLLALEYVLFGSGHEDLLTAGDYRCRYGTALGGAIAATAADIENRWTAPGGFADQVRNAGPDNEIFRSHTEAFQLMLKSAAEMLQIDRDLKLGASLGAMIGEAKPKRAPFWRSDLTLRSITENIAGAMAVHDALGIADLLPPEWQSESAQLAFEIEQVARTVEQINEHGGRFVDLAGDQWGHDALTYMEIPLHSAIEILGVRYPAELGLVLGFNALDGD